MNRTPLVTVGMPVFDGEAFVGAALAAVLAQDLGDLEVVVSDNASTDATASIVRAAADGDPRVRYHRSDRNLGAAWNYRRTLELARGRLFKWAAHDDLCRPGLLGACVAALDATPDAVLAYPRTSLIDRDGQVVGHFEDGLDLRQPTPGRRMAQLLAHEGEYHPIFGVIRTAALRDTQVMGGYVGADIVVLAELALRGRFVEIEDRLFLRRYHDGTSVRANPDASGRASWFDPRPRRWTPMPTARLTTELVRAVAGAPVDPRTRTTCLGAVARHWVLPRWRDIGGEIKVRSRELSAAVGRPATSLLAGTDQGRRQRA